MGVSFPAIRRGFGMALAMMLLTACSAVERTSADRFTANGELLVLSGGDAGAANACFVCHGLDGGGNGAGAPRLAGLHPGYLDRQLEAYASGLRRHSAMEYIAHRFTPSQRLSVSAFYASLPFDPSAMPNAAAPRLYVEGDRARGLLPCAECHGLRGEGVGPANPPLGGQPAPYLAEQLQKWRRSERRNDPLKVMLEISRRLSPGEISVLAAYAARLPGGPPHPGSPATFLGAHRSGPRSDVSGQRPHEAAR